MKIGITGKIRLFLLVASLTCCTSEDEFPLNKSYPFVISKIVKIDNTGVILGGEILNMNTQNINNVGFVVTGFSNLPQEVKIMKVSEVFEFNLNVDIPTGKEYTFRAFAKSDSIITYGNSVTFISQGFKTDAPQIDSLSTSEVTDNSVVKIYGHNFSVFKENVNVLIGNKEGQINSTTFNEIEFKMPKGLSSGVYPLSVVIYDKVITGDDLRIMNPVIYNFSPKSGFDGTEITITGKFFSDNTTTNLYFGEGQITDYYFVSDSLIRFTIPETSIFGDVNIKVDVSGKLTTASEGFNVLGHSVSNISAVTGQVGDIVDIYGDNFVQNERVSEVLFNNTAAEIIEINNNHISCYVPNIHDIANNIVVKVINGAKEVIVTENFTILPTWTALGNVPFSARAHAASVVIDGHGYVGLGQSRWWGKNLYNDWWRYNPSTDSWNQIKSYPGELHSNYIYFSVNGKAYIGYMSDMDGVYVDLWEYDPQLDNWTKKASLNGNVSSNFENASAVVHNNIAYLMDPANRERMYKYDAAIDEWSYVDIPDFYESYTYHFKPFSLVLNERIYWFFGSTPTYDQTTTIRVIEYLPASNEWNEVVKFSNNGKFNDHATYFSLNGKGYFGGGRRFLSANASSNYFWRFDPEALTLAVVENFIAPVTYQSALAIDNVAYIGLGYDSSLNPKNDFWLFKPN